MLDILLVDDEPSICLVIKDCLEDLIYSVVTCVGSGEEGAHLIANHHYDLAVIDVLVPGLSGFKLAEQAVEKNVPVLLLSGHPQIQSDCVAYGWPHLPKPFSIVTLEEQVLALIQETQKNIAQVKKSAERMRENLAKLKSRIAESQYLLNESANIIRGSQGK